MDDVFAKLPPRFAALTLANPIGVKFVAHVPEFDNFNLVRASPEIFGAVSSSNQRKACDAEENADSIAQVDFFAEEEDADKRGDDGVAAVDE